MGYVFDALNRGGQEPRKPQINQTSADSPKPAPPPESFKFVAPGVDGGSAAATSFARDAVDDRLVALVDPASIMAEEYRAIRTGLLAKWEHRRHLVHTITSATPQEGKTLTSLNLGMIFAELRNRKTIVIEGDLRLPQFGKLLGLPQSAGLTGVLEEDADLASTVHRIGEQQLHVLCAGRRVNNEAVQLLSSAKMASLLKFLRREYDHVIIDTPPVVELADAGILGSMSDDVLLIARMNRTPKSLIEQAIRTLAGYNAPVAGLVATDQPHHRRRYYYYRYGYRYQYHYTKAA